MSTTLLADRANPADRFLDLELADPDTLPPPLESFVSNGHRHLPVVLTR